MADNVLKVLEERLYGEISRSEQESGMLCIWAALMKTLGQV
jgi:hypothetical protein